MKLMSDCWLLVILMHPLKKWNQHVQESSYSHLANGIHVECGVESVKCEV